MKSNRQRIHDLTFLGLTTAAAILLSYIEILLPPIFSAVPGIKIGLPNIAIIYLLYSYGVREAAVVSFIRVALVSMFFGNVMMFAYSLAGACLSLAVMALLKRLNFLSAAAVSIAGGISHNLGQILVAMLLLHTAEIGYYMIVLTLTGMVSGLFVGLAGALLIKRLPPKRSK